MGNKQTVGERHKRLGARNGGRVSPVIYRSSCKRDQGVQAETEAGELRSLSEKYDLLLTRTRKIEQSLACLEQMLGDSKENVPLRKSQVESERNDLNLDSLFLRKRIIPPTAGPQKQLKKALFGRPSDEKRSKLNSQSLTNL